MNAADFTIKVNTSGSSTILAYIEASSLDSESKAYLPMQVFLTNTPPTFTQEVVAIQVELTPQAQQATTESSEESQSGTQAAAQSYIFQIPDLKDEEQADEDLTLTIDGLKDWMQYTEADQSITFNDITTEKIGVYNIQFTLKDSFGAENIIVTTFEVKLPEVEEATDEEESSEQTEEEQEAASQEAALLAAFPGIDLTKFDKSTTFEQLSVLTSLKVDEETDILKGKIQKISEFGVTQIDFNKFLRSEFKYDGQVIFNGSNINSDVLDVYVEPALDRHQSPGFNISSLNLTWNVSSFEKNQLKLQINFSEPTSISPLLEQDVLVVAFKQPYWFYSDVLRKSLEKEFHVMRKKIRKQMANTAFNKGFSEKSEQTEDAMKWVMILSFVMNVFMTGDSTIYFVGWINAMQMIMHLPMLKPVLPANVLKVMTNILPIVSFDLIESEYSTDLIFDFEDPDNQFYEDFSNTAFGQMQDIGYESHNSIKILGSMFIFKMVFFLRLFVQLPLFWLYSKLSNSGQDKINELKKQLFWGEVLVMCLEGYIELLIAGYLNFEFYLYSTNGEVTARWVAFYCLVVSLIIMPAVIIYVICQKPDKVKEDAFYERWGVMYEDIKTENRWQYATYGVFMLRRFIFVTLCFYLQDQPSMQILGVNALNLFMLIYTGKIRAQQRRFRNRLDIFNEICISVISWHLMFFANEDYLPDPKMQYTMGWSMAVGIGINIIVNFTIIFATGCKSIYLTCQKVRNLWKFAIYGDDPDCPLQSSSDEDVTQADNKSKKDELSLRDIEQVTEEEPMNEEERKDRERREFSLKLAQMVERWDAEERRKRERQKSPKFGQPDQMIPLADELQDIQKSQKDDKKKKKVDPFEEFEMRLDKEYKEIQVYEDRIKLVDDLSAKLKKIPINDPQRREIMRDIKTKLFEIRDEVFSSKVPESEAVKEKWIELRSNVNMATITLKRPKPVENVNQSDTMKIMGDYMLDSARNNKYMPMSKKERLIREEREMRAKAAEAWKKYQQR